MQRNLAVLRNRGSAFRHDCTGSIAVIFAFALLPLIAVAGAGYDLLAIGAMRGQLQMAADTGALRAARELRLAKAGNYDLTPVARSAIRDLLIKARQSLSNVTMEASLVESNTAVKVTVKGTYDPKIIRLLYKEPINLGASAVARTNGFPVCALGLEPDANRAVFLEANARVTAQYCAVHSNSKSPQGLSGANNSFLKAGMICSSGGKVGNKVNFEPEPLTDCPVVPDPLAQRAPPPIGGCTHNNEKIEGGTITLSPGVYCGGLKITSAAKVTLAPGEYIIKDGPLKVDGGSSFTALNVGIFLTGADSVFRFAPDSSVHMSAPMSGPMAGILFFEDPNAPSLREHRILSDDAPLLLGTIYLPKGRLEIETNKPVAQQSAFTIIVAQRMELYGGAELVLNSNYEASAVPVPGGLNPGMSYLIK